MSNAHAEAQLCRKFTAFAKLLNIYLNHFPKAERYALAGRIGDFLADNLRLEFSKTTIAKASRGVNFVGYRTWRKARFIRKHSLYKFRRYLRAGESARVVSLLGHAKGTASLPHMIHLIQEERHADLSLPKKIRRLHHL